MHIRLPSGRSLNYHGLKWQRYRVEDPNTKKMVSKEGWTYLNPQGNGYIGTYGGRLTENVVQATARDIMAEAMIALEEQGFEVVGTVHDELLIDGAHDLGYVEDIMCTPPDWCREIPLAVEGGHLARYAK
jgi:DNA polymerase